MMDDSKPQSGMDDESWMDEMGWGEDAAETSVGLEERARAATTTTTTATTRPLTTLVAVRDRRRW